MYWEVTSLQNLTLVALWLAAIGTTAFPVLYLFSPWYKSILGRTMMAQAWAFALTVDATLLFRYWQPPSIWTQLVSALLLVYVAGTAVTLTSILWILNYQHRLSKETDEFREQPGDD